MPTTPRASATVAAMASMTRVNDVGAIDWARMSWRVRSLASARFGMTALIASRPRGARWRFPAGSFGPRSLFPAERRGHHYAGSRTEHHRGRRTVLGHRPEDSPRGRAESRPIHGHSPPHRMISRHIGVPESTLHLIVCPGMPDPLAEGCCGAPPAVLGEVRGDHRHRGSRMDVRPYDGAPREERDLHGLEIAPRDPLVLRDRSLPGEVLDPDQTGDSPAPSMVRLAMHRPT